MSKKKKKKSALPPGRPKKVDAPLIPWEDIDHILVCGEEIVNEYGNKVVYYPSYRELGERFNVAHSLIARYSRHHNCILRRKDTKIRTRALAEGQVIARRAADLSVTMDDALRIIDLAIIRFGEALEEGRARVDSVADLNTLLRLKQLLLGQADSRKAIQHEINLDTLQQRHRQWLKERQLIPAEDDESAQIAVKNNCTKLNTLNDENHSENPPLDSEIIEHCSIIEDAETIENHTEIPPTRPFEIEHRELPVQLRSINSDATNSDATGGGSEAEDPEAVESGEMPIFEAEFTPVKGDDDVND